MRWSSVWYGEEEEHKDCHSWCKVHESLDIKISTSIFMHHTPRTGLVKSSFEFFHDILQNFLANPTGKQHSWFLSLFSHTYYTERAMTYQVDVSDIRNCKRSCTNSEFSFQVSYQFFVSKFWSSPLTQEVIFGPSLRSQEDKFSRNSLLLFFFANFRGLILYCAFKLWISGTQTVVINKG